MRHRELFLGFVKLHILYHAQHEPLFGLAMIRELAHHGYSLSPGTLYPVLHKMEKEHLLRSSRKNVAGKIRKYYQITAVGCRALAQGVDKARELFEEIGGNS